MDKIIPMYEVEAEIPPVLVTLTGPPGVGKSMLARRLDSLSPQHLVPEFANEYFDIHMLTMRQLLTWNGYQGSNRLLELQAYHRQERAAGRAEEILEPLHTLANGIFLLDATRHPDDQRYIHEKFGGLSIALNAPLSVCEDRFMSDDSDEKHVEINNRLKELKVEATSGEWKRIYDKVQRNLWDASTEEFYDFTVTSMREAEVRLDASVSPEEVLADAVACIHDHITNLRANGSTQYH